MSGTQNQPSELILRNLDGLLPFGGCQRCDTHIQNSRCRRRTAGLAAERHDVTTGVGKN